MDLKTIRNCYQKQDKKQFFKKTNIHYQLFNYNLARKLQNKKYLYKSKNKTKKNLKKKNNFFTILNKLFLLRKKNKNQKKNCILSLPLQKN